MADDAASGGAAPPPFEPEPQAAPGPVASEAVVPPASEAAATPSAEAAPTSGAEAAATPSTETIAAPSGEVAAEPTPREIAEAPPSPQAVSEKEAETDGSDPADIFPHLEADEGLGPERVARPMRGRAARGVSVPWWQTRRTLWIGLASLGLCAVIAIDVFFMQHAAERGPDAAPSASAPAASASATPAPAASNGELDDGSDEAPRAEAKGVAAGEADDTALPAFDEDDVDTGSNPKKKKEPPHFGTVQEAAARSCSTASVDGLSRQIIEQGRCINPKAFVPLPARPNLVVNEHVFPYLEASARDRLLKALDARRGSTMTINSALRTVAQQYLVWRWSASKRCGVQLATPPGESNHETGLALDIAEQADWRQVLETYDFHWLGSIDRVHFDYKGSTNSSNSQRATDVLAFQQLWNKNNPSDPIAESGRYGPETEQRLKKAPADGFAIGLACKGRNSKPSPVANSGKRTR